MSYHFSQTEQAGYLEFHVHGQRNFEDAYRFWKTVANELEQRNLQRVLVEFDLEGDAPDEDFQVMLQKMKLWARRPWERIAVVDHHPKRVIMLSIMELDKRFPARMFSSIDGAREWLSQNNSVAA